MIVSDNPHHKIDVEFNKDGWLHITVFHRKSDTEWTSKMIGIGPDAQAQVAQMIAERIAAKEEQSCTMPDAKN